MWMLFPISSFLQGHGFVGFQGGRFDDLPCAAVLHRRNGGEEQGHFEFIHLFTCFFLVLIINLLILHRNSRIFQEYPSKFVIIKQMTVHTCMYET